MAMTKQHFDLIAKTIKEAYEAEQNPERREVLDNLAETFARKLSRTNPNFNMYRFLEACIPADAK